MAQLLFSSQLNYNFLVILIIIFYLAQLLFSSQLSYYFLVSLIIIF